MCLLIWKLLRGRDWAGEVHGWIPRPWHKVRAQQIADVIVEFHRDARAPRWVWNGPSDVGQFALPHLFCVDFGELCFYALLPCL